MDNEESSHLGHAKTGSRRPQHSSSRARKSKARDIGASSGAIPIGVLGSGEIAATHSHAYKDLSILLRRFSITPSLVDVCDVIKTKAQSARTRFGYRRALTDWRDVVRDPEIEVVDNCLPNRFHCEPSIEAAEAGKNVICEKPLALNFREALRMYEAVKKTGVHHCTAFNYRWFPAVRLASRLILGGDIGRPLHVRVQFLQDYSLDRERPLLWWFRSRESGSGAIGDLGSHAIDLARFVVGEVKRTCAVAKTFIKERPLEEEPNKKGRVDVDDACVALLEFKNGAIGTLESSRVYAGGSVLSLQVDCTNGTVAFNSDRCTVLRVYSGNETPEKQGFRAIKASGAMHLGEEEAQLGYVESSGDTYRIELGMFLKSIAEDELFTPSFHDGAVNCAIIDAILESAKTEKWVNVPKPPK